MAAPLYRGQGNNPFRTNAAVTQAKRGQTVPYDTNGSPTVALPSIALNISIIDLPSADPAKPLLRYRLTKDYTFSPGVADAGIAATGTPALRMFKNGSSCGTIDFSGSTGTISFSDSTFPSGSLFELYPPTASDATLDRVSISIATA